MKKIKYPLIKPSILKKDCQYLEEVLKSGWLTQGRWVSQSEEFLKKYLNIKFARLLNSATSGLICAIKAFDFSLGSKIIVPSFTFPATSNAVIINNLVPVFCDIDLNTFNASIETIEKVFNKDVKAVVVVDEFGLSVDLEPIRDFCRKNRLFLIEDSACSLGAEYKGKKVGTLSDIAVFSFHPRKIVTSGEGGAVVTNLKSIDKKIDYLRNHGEFNKRFISFGYNFRLSDIQASILYAQLERIEKIIEERIKLANNYHNLLKDLEEKELIKRPTCPKGFRHIYQSYVLLLDKRINRDRLKLILKEKGIETQFGTYCVPILDFYSKNFKIPFSSYRNAYFAYKHTLTLPLYKGLTLKDQIFIIENFKKEIKKCVQ